jgi:hypothetical protein
MLKKTFLPCFNVDKIAGKNFSLNVENSPSSKSKIPDKELTLASTYSE